ncbi:MAG: prepilin peptidase [OCS116 cluster bacterium]|uniref:Prepilin type IV endopeptidase peptidase domain-containing protein n=1 Tax=OCS116 cluster bacterium TaxID=2030921 RepID=A0A2A4YWZ6_9PROT|nr:prepilin peptidase [OCS116 cluster bacterium]
MDNFLVIFIKYFFPAIMVGIILWDFFTMIIPNGLNILLFVGFLGLAMMIDMSLEDIGWHLLAAFLALAAGFAAFAFNLFGGGDAKSIAAATAWFGWSTESIIFILLTAILGGAFAIALITIRSSGINLILPAKIVDMKWVKSILVPEARMPYGVAIGAAGLIMYSPKVWLS